ncbi:hypothetical protein GCM10010405_49760 [Streptomyces macrosporus]|uniref:Uncharacterized protein n=1 Tax=Streptomyces macrosporus TaxID=44032 RepID=A0ABN3KKJ0_9ACTN
METVLLVENPSTRGFTLSVTPTARIARQIGKGSLSATVPTQVAVDLLEGGLGRRLSELLRTVPTGVDLADADASEAAPGSADDRARHLLMERDDIGWVTAGKLLARKRPGLLPAYGQVVHCALGRPRTSGRRCTRPCTRTTGLCTIGSSNCGGPRAYPRRSAPCGCVTWWCGRHTAKSIAPAADTGEGAAGKYRDSLSCEPLRGPRARRQACGPV